MWWILLFFWLSNQTIATESPNMCDSSGNTRNIEFQPDSPVKYPFDNSDDAQCRQIKIRFAAPNSLPLVALASFPGSGNTWLRSDQILIK